MGTVLKGRNVKFVMQQIRATVYGAIATLQHLDIYPTGWLLKSDVNRN